VKTRSSCAIVPIEWKRAIVGVTKPSRGMHGEASFQGQLVMMGQRALERSMQSPREAGAATMGGFIYLDDVDKHYAVAKAAGAEIVDPPKTVE
jgi:uncharacterized glyoxalase superfamily protein PhnB